MSRIGKKSINIPNDISLSIIENNIIVKGKLGTLQKTIHESIYVELKGNILSVFRKDDLKKTRALHGLTRALINNMIKGVSQQFVKTLLAEGVGYKFQLEQNNLVVVVGYSHPISFSVPNNLNVKVESPTRICISGMEKEKVGFFASKIREARPPEPYKGKGILYLGETILRKAGKTGK
jgi:large subunit ribosomal protein L6